jgi:ABC-type uncharacterized transport system, permease component
MNQQKLIREIFSGNAVIPIFAVLASFVFGGILIAFANEEVQEASGYFFARPIDTVTAVLNSVFGAYDALFRGSIFNYQAATPQAMIKPITETLAFATPITLAGLGLAVAFRSGLFNIGGQGQIIFGCDVCRLRWLELRGTVFGPHANGSACRSDWWSAVGWSCWAAEGNHWS